MTRAALNDLHQNTEAGFDVAAAAMQVRFPDFTPANANILTGTADATATAMLSPGRRRAFFVNTCCIERASKDARYRDALGRADMLLPNGAQCQVRDAADERPDGHLHGTNLMPHLLAQAARRKKTVFLIGGTAGTAEAAALAMMLKVPGLRIAGTCSRQKAVGRPAVAIDQINAAGADIVLVSMESPEQEIWLDSHGHRIGADLQFAVGAAFDAFVRYVIRSPRLIADAGVTQRPLPKTVIGGRTYPFG